MTASDQIDWRKVRQRIKQPDVTFTRNLENAINAVLDKHRPKSVRTGRHTTPIRHVHQISDPQALEGSLRVSGSGHCIAWEHLIQLGQLLG